MKILINSVFFFFIASLKLFPLPLTSSLPSVRHSLPFAIIAEINRALKCRIRLVSLRWQRLRYLLVQCRNFAIYLPKFSCGQIKWPECFKLQSFCSVLFISYCHSSLYLCFTILFFLFASSLKFGAITKRLRAMRARAFRQRLSDLALWLTDHQVARLPGRQVATIPGCQVVRSPAQQAGRRQVPRRIIANHLSNKWTKSRYATTNESRVELRWVRALTATTVQWAEAHIFWRHPYIFR